MSNIIFIYEDGRVEPTTLTHYVEMLNLMEGVAKQMKISKIIFDFSENNRNDNYHE